MTEKIEAILIEAIEDEYKACATYRLIIKTFGDVPPFSNIVVSENRHIQALTTLFDAYNLPLPEDTWDLRVVAPASLVDGCKDGVAAEIENAAMYDRLLAQAQAYPDISRVLRQLQRASQENHLPAFKRCVERGGEGSGRGKGRRCRGGRQ